MNADELNLLRGSLESLTKAISGNQVLTAQLNDLLAGQAGMCAKLDGLEVISRDQLQKLFGYHDEHAARLGLIEKTYVAREICERTHDKADEAERPRRVANAEDHGEFREQINSLSVRMAAIGGGIAVVTAGLNWLASNWHIIGAASK